MRLIFLDGGLTGESQVCESREIIDANQRFGRSGHVCRFVVKLLNPAFSIGLNRTPAIGIFNFAGENGYFLALENACVPKLKMGVAQNYEASIAF